MALFKITLQKQSLYPTVPWMAVSALLGGALLHVGKKEDKHYYYIGFPCRRGRHPTRDWARVGRVLARSWRGPCPKWGFPPRGLTTERGRKGSHPQPNFSSEEIHPCPMPPAPLLPPGQSHRGHSHEGWGGHTHWY